MCSIYREKRKLYLIISTMPINKTGRDDGIRKSLLGNHLSNNSGKKH